MQPYLFGLVFVVICLIVGRIMGERAFRSLTDEEKVRLMDAFSGLRAYSMLPLVAIIFVAFALPRYVEIPQPQAILVPLALVTVYAIVMHILVLRRLNRLDLPYHYRRWFLISRHIGHLGMLVLFSCLAYVFW